MFSCLHPFFVVVHLSDMGLKVLFGLMWLVLLLFVFVIVYILVCLFWLFLLLYFEISMVILSFVFWTCFLVVLLVALKDSFVLEIDRYLGFFKDDFAATAA